MDEPKELSEGLYGVQARVILFLDGLNGYFLGGKYYQVPFSEKEPLLAEPSFHDQLLKSIHAIVRQQDRTSPRCRAAPRSSLADEL